MPGTRIPRSGADHGPGAGRWLRLTQVHLMLLEPGRQVQQVLVVTANPAQHGCGC